MDSPSKHVLYLSKKIGPRGAGCAGEETAASYILQDLNKSEIEVKIESFSSHKSDYHGLMIIYLLTVAAYLIFALSYWAGLIIAILTFLVFQMETYTWCVVSKLLPRGSAANILGRVKAEDKMRHRVVLVANYDTPRSSPFGNPKIARLFRAFYIISFVCMICITLICALGVGASLAKVSRSALLKIWFACCPFAVYILILLTLLALGEIYGRYTPGANDNASGVGVMLSLISSIKNEPLKNTEVWSVATARGFAGGRGMAAFLRRHSHQLKNAVFINLDHLGVDKTKIIKREGLMLGFGSSRALRHLAYIAATKMENVKVGRGNCRVKKSDCMVALARGYKAISIAGLRGGTYRGWRQRSDVYEKINAKNLDRAVQLVKLILEEIDAMA